MQWRVLKHLIAASILPVLTVIGLIVYMRLPSDLSFAEALFQGDIKTVHYYLDTERLLLNAPLEGDSQERAPLHLAALGNNTNMVRDLVFRGAVLDITDDNGFTPLHYASNVRNAEMADFLLAQGAPVDARDRNERTPLHIAAITGSVQVLAVLVFNGNADLKAADVDQYRATDYSRLFHASAMQRLLDDGYYHDEKGAMKVIAHDKFEAMRHREGVYPKGTTAGAGSQARSSAKGQPKGKGGKRLPTVQATEKEQATPRTPKPAVVPVEPSVADAEADEDDSFMSLFTGESAEEETKKRYQRDTAAAKRSEAQLRDAVEEYEAIAQGGAVDRDEFEI